MELHLSIFDPDLDVPPRPQRPGLNDGPPKRLLVNPFLVVIDWLAAVTLLRAGIKRVEFSVFLAGAILLLLGFILLRYHCLDCGATGWALMHRRHACSPGQVPKWRRLRVPSITIQVVIWGYLLAAAIALFLILRRA